jgi:hypothetical protein
MGASRSSKPWFYRPVHHATHYALDCRHTPVPPVRGVPRPSVTFIHPPSPHPHPPLSRGPLHGMRHVCAGHCKLRLAVQGEVEDARRDWCCEYHAPLSLSPTPCSASVDPPSLPAAAAAHTILTPPPHTHTHTHPIFPPHPLQRHLQCSLQVTRLQATGSRRSGGLSSWLTLL